MSAVRFGRTQKAMTLVPLALLSGAWTASLAGLGAAAVVATTGTTLPDGTTVPAEAIEVPASLSNPSGVGPGIRGNADQIISTASTNGIPAAAIAAYQRAEQVINAADPSCQLPWQLIAAIGRVESDHGRSGGNTLDANGVARPGIYGIALDGTKDTAVIRDTDAGQYDNDAAYDRAVGPMQFIPSTWAVVGVDADGDARRNPQDIDDSALGTAVYLCSGSDDLSTDAGRRAAVYRYNHSFDYVDLVLSIFDAYTAGDYTSVPNSVTSASWFPTATNSVGPVKNNGGKGGTSTDPTDDPTVPGDDPSDDPTPPGDDPTEPADDPTQDPVTGVTEDPVGTVEDTIEDPVGTVEDTLSFVEATAACIAEGKIDNPLDPNDAFDQCMDEYGY